MNLAKRRGMNINEHIPNSQNDSRHSYVGASVIATEYNITSRYVLKLAAENKIPSLRLGKKCVRFDRNAVAEALENNKSNT